jgi:hypothetical protein
MVTGTEAATANLMRMSGVNMEKTMFFPNVLCICSFRFRVAEGDCVDITHTRSRKAGIKWIAYDLLHHQWLRHSTFSTEQGACQSNDG